MFHNINQKKLTLTERAEELRERTSDAEKNNKSLQDKVNESEKLKISELQTTQKLTVDNQKLKTEFDKVKVEGEEGEKKISNYSRKFKIKIRSIRIRS